MSEQINPFQTRLTEMLGIQYPVIMAPMFLVSNVAMVKAAMDSGITGAIPALNYRTLKELADAIRELKEHGGAFGINLIVAFFEVRTRFHADALSATQIWGNGTTKLLMDHVEHLMQRVGLPFQQQKAAALEYLGTMVQAQAQNIAFSDTFIVISLVSLLALLPAIFLSRSQLRARKMDLH